MKSMELKTYNLPNEKILLSEINAKPTWAFIALTILGVISLITGIPAIYGVMMIAIGIMCAIFMPKVPLIEFYNDFFIMHNRAEKTKCVLIYYNEVKSWFYSWNPTEDFLFVELEDGSVEKIKAFSKTLFEIHMNKYLRNKRLRNNENRSS